MSVNKISISLFLTNRRKVLRVTQYVVVIDVIPECCLPSYPSVRLDTQHQPNAARNDVTLKTCNVVFHLVM